MLRLGIDTVAGAFIGLLITEIIAVLLCVTMKKGLVGSEWGADHSTPFWSWRHFAYFLAQDCFFVWCRGPLAFCAGTILANPILRWMGCRIGRRTIVTSPMQCFDWNAVSFGDDCVDRRLPAVSHLREHDAEGETNPYPGRLRRQPSAPR